MRTEDFINNYEYLYYDPSIRTENTKKYEEFENFKMNYYGKTDVSSEDYKAKQKSILGINDLNGTDYNAEKKIVEEWLEFGKFDKIALAWKAGKISFKNGELSTVGFEKDTYYINGFGGHIPKNEFEEYYNSLNQENQDQIIKFVKENDWKNEYDVLNRSPATNIGPVYNINTLFFLTKGKAPIYDAFAHKAVKSLLLGIAPSEVYLGANPNKIETEKVVLMYREYMLLLKMFFPNEIHKEGNDDMFISRELDRALWVYGHSIKQFEMRLQ